MLLGTTHHSRGCFSHLKPISKLEKEIFATFARTTVTNHLVELLSCVNDYPMTETESAILQTILELENTVRLMPTANPKPSLLPFWTRLDALTRQLPSSSDPDLLHYLHKRSYEKARLWLQGRDAENQAGNCRHV